MNEDILSEGLMSVADACEFLAIGRSTLWRLMNAGKIAYTNIGHSRRLPRRAVMALAQGSLHIPTE